ncbi:MAG: hypothetical protein AABY22_17585 [Nanoarchaeota archaeon]
MMYHTNLDEYERSFLTPACALLLTMGAAAGIVALALINQPHSKERDIKDNYSVFVDSATSNTRENFKSLDKLTE